MQSSGRTQLTARRGQTNKAALKSVGGRELWNGHLAHIDLDAQDVRFRGKADIPNPRPMSANDPKPTIKAFYASLS